jgi:hypothetical protein
MGNSYEYEGPAGQEQAPGTETEDMSDERIIHEFVPVAGDGLEKVVEADLLNKSFLVRDFTGDIPSAFIEGGTYTAVIIERSDGENAKWLTGAKAIPDQLEKQQLPCRVALKRRKGLHGQEYLTLAPASEAEGPL